MASLSNNSASQLEVCFIATEFETSCEFGLLHQANTKSHFCRAYRPRNGLAFRASVRSLTRQNNTPVVHVSCMFILSD